MNRIRSILGNLVRVGVNQNQSHILQREIILSNKISLLLLPMALIGFLISYNQEVFFTSVGCGILFLFLGAILTMNKYGGSLISRFLLSIVPQFSLLLPNILGGVGRIENFFTFSFLFIAFTFIPLLLFQSKKSFGILIIALMINLMLVLFYDVLLAWSSSNYVDLRLIENNYFYYKFPQLILWFLVVSVLQYIKKVNQLSEERYHNTNEKLIKLNADFHDQHEKIVAQDIAFSALQEKSIEQTSKLQSKNHELNSTKIELLNTIEKLKEAKEKLLQKEAEARSIFNALNEHYLVAQYDLDGNLVSINTKVIELLGVLKDEQFQHIKPAINQSHNESLNGYNGRKFNKVWRRIKSGHAQTVDLEYHVGDSKKFLATTFAPLFDQNNKPYKILAIGHDVSELVEQNGKIDRINEELKEKIHEISQQNQLLNFQQAEIFDKSEELHRQKEEIQSINESLEQRVQERTKVLEEKNKQLAEYAFINSHVLRSPVSTMMGLLNLMKYSDLPEEEKKVYEHLQETAKVLDNVVYKINNAIDNGFHFDRDYLEPGRNFYPLNGVK